MEEALREAKQLCEAGVLSHAEFNVAKRKISVRTEARAFVSELRSPYMSPLVTFATSGILTCFSTA